MKLTKKILPTLLCTILILSLCLPVIAFAQTPFTLRVGYWPGYGISENENGGISGYTYDYMREIARINGWQVEFVACGWNEGLQRLSEGSIDTFGPLQKTPERAQQYDYPELRAGYECGTLYIKDDNNTAFYNDLASLNGKTLGTVDDNYYTQAVLDFCRENGITISVKIINDAVELNKAFSDGTIDFRVSGSMLAPENAKVVLHLTTEDFYYPTTKGNKKVLKGINDALQTIQTEKPYYDAVLYNKYYAQAAIGKRAFTAQEAAYIRNAPPLRVGCDSVAMPMEYYDEQSDTIQGITVDLMQCIAQYSGLRFEFIKTNSMEHARQLLDAGEVDMLSNLVGVKQFTELYGLLPSDALMSNTLAFIVKQGTNFDKAADSLALPEKAVGIRQHIAEQYPKVPVQLYRDTDSCLDAIINGQNKWTVLNTMTAERMLKAHEYQNLGANEMTNGEISICFGVPLNADPTLLPVLNKSIAAISDSTRKQIVYEHTISQPYQPTTREILYYNLPAFSVGVIVLLVGLYLFNLYSKKKLNQLAYYDTLTGEMNLNRFKLEAQKLMGRPGRQNAVMVVDIDKFKAINDLYGYEFGDKMLILLAKTLRGAMLPGTILCHGVADKFDCFFEYHGDMWMNERFACLAQAVKQAIAEQMPSCNIVLSAGVCVIQPTDHNIISIIDHANIAAKQIKSYHESSFAFYRQSMSDKINQTRAIENSMSDALQNGEFVVYLQPKIDLATSRIAGAEALVRWQHPRHGIIPPIEFIPLFEENGFIVSLDFYMLEHVCRMLERWKAEGRALFTVSVNLSRRHLFMADTAQRLSDIVKKYDVNPQFIEVELTESAFDNCDIESINALFYELHRRGFTVSVDDFGAGYSSLSLLKDLSIDVLKIDKSFFDCAQSCATNKMDILLESVISLSRRLNIKTVSEGVETVQQVNLLLQLGCDLVQGYYFARPMPVQQLEQLLEGGDLFGAAEPLSAIPAT